MIAICSAWLLGVGREGSHIMADAGEYRLLYTYLRDRYASRVVLTFGQIEDLLGFALPAPARREREWWDATAPPLRPSIQSAAWTLADRTATVNLSAQTVTFEREVPPRPARP
jgi:hypothetical protein